MLSKINSFADKKLDDELLNIYQNIFVMSKNITSLTYDIKYGDSILLLDGTSNAVTATLPPAKGNRGKTYFISAINIANTVTIARTGTDTIEGSTSYVFAAVKISVVLGSDGESNWKIIAYYTPVSAIDHDALLNFVANEHIDWTNASNNLSTSGTITSSNKVITPEIQRGVTNNRLNIYGSTSLSTGAGIEIYSTGIGYNRGNINIISNTASGSGEIIFLSTPNGSSFPISAKFDSSGNLGVGGQQPDRKFHTELSDTATNSVSYVERITHISTNTPAAGFGVGKEFELEDNAGNNNIAGTTDCIWTDPTNGSEDADFVFKLMAGAAAAAEKGRITSTGDIKASGGFYSAGNQGLSGTLTLDDGANWRITLTFSGGILTGQTTGASTSAAATWV
jgi:hypothetical protein